MNQQRGREGPGELAPSYESHHDVLQAAIDNWLDGIYNFEYGFDPSTMQRIAGVRPMHRHMDCHFWTPANYRDGDARSTIVHAYRTTQEVRGTPGEAFVTRRLGKELDILFAPQVDFIKSDWEAGRMVRRSEIMHGGVPSIIYNCMPAFEFTGEVVNMPHIDAAGCVRTEGLLPVIDLSPQTDDRGHFVPYRPGAEVIILPDPLQSGVTLQAMRGHILALRQAVHPKYQRFMPNWHGVDAPAVQAA